MRPLLLAIVALLVLGAAAVALLVFDEAPLPPTGGGQGGGTADPEALPPEDAEPVDPAAEDPDDDGTLPERPEDGDPLFLTPESAAALRRVDWPEFGAHLALMARVAEEQVVSVNAATQLPESRTAAARAAMDAAFLTYASLREVAPSAHPQGEVTHPLVVANAFDATLLATDLPLTAKQVERISALLDEHLKLETERMEADDTDRWLVTRIRAEAEQRQRFYDALYGVLTPRQHKRIRPRAVRGRVNIDFFSTAMYWGPMLLPHPVDTESLEPMSWSIGDRLQATYGVQLFETPEETGAFLREEVPELFERPYDWNGARIDRAGHFPAAAAVAAAKITESLLDRLAERFSDSAELKHSFRNAFVVVFPHAP